MFRPDIAELVGLGAFPPSDSSDAAVIRRQEELLRRIKQPLSDDEVRELVKLFGPDDYFGLA